MIKSFGDKKTKKIFNRLFSKQFPKELHEGALRKLIMIDSALNTNDLRNPPSNHLEKLSGTRKNQYSIRLNSKWRVCFMWDGRDAYHVEIIDYY